MLCYVWFIGLFLCVFGGWFNVFGVWNNVLACFAYLSITVHHPSRDLRNYSARKKKAATGKQLPPPLFWFYTRQHPLPSDLPFSHRLLLYIWRNLIFFFRLKSLIHRPKKWTHFLFFFSGGIFFIWKSWFICFCLSGLNSIFRCNAFLGESVEWDGFLMVRDGGGTKGGLEFTFIKIESCACLLVLPSSVTRSWKSLLA